MKVSGTGKGPEAADGGPETEAAPKTEAAGVADGETFADKLEAGAPSAHVEAADATSSAPVDPADRLTADLADDLRAGKVGVEAALERVVERIIDSQAGPHASEAVRDSLRAALRDALEQDPLVAELTAKLRRTQGA
jgi:hypothetical protein